MSESTSPRPATAKTVLVGVQETGENPSENPLTAAFGSVPLSHDGDAFRFTLTFSEDVGGLSYLTLKNSAFNVTGGRVKNAVRRTQGSNRSWSIEIEPDGDGAVSIVLPKTMDCNAAGAICTPDDRKLSNESRGTVDGPARLHVNAIADDNTINIAEKAAGFAIGGDTGSVGGVAVTVSVGGEELTATSADADPAAWSVSVPGNAPYIAGTSVDVEVNASKAGYTAPATVERRLTVDLEAPTAPTYTAPGSLQVGVAIMAVSPSGGTGIDEFSATGLPSGLSIDAASGAISGTPDTADADVADATVTVTVADTAGNTDTVAIAFLAVEKGDQALSGFRYSATSVTFGSSAPTVTAPTGAQTALRYSATPVMVCAVKPSTGVLSLVGVGSCEITATAAGTDDWNEATATVTVTVQRAGTVRGTVTHLITPTDIALTQGDGRTDFSYALENLIDGSGLSEPPTVVNLDSVTHDSGSSARRWETNTSGSPDYFGDSSNYPDPQFTLTLDKRYSVSSLVFWGVGGNTNEASDFTVEFSTDGGTSYGTAVETVQTDSVAGNNHANLSFDMAHEANFVRLTVTNNAKGRGFAGVGGDRVGLGEIRFMGTDATPPGGPVAAAGSLATLVDTAGTLDLSTLVTGAEGTTLGYTATAPSNGTTSVSGSVVIYTPNTGYFGTDSFTYTVTDVADARVTATGVVSVTVTAGMPPAVTITSSATHPTKDPFDVTLTFSADVTGFAAAEVTVTGGTAAASFTSSTARVYAIAVTPEADYAGDLTVEVAEDAAEADGVGNAAASATFAVDAKAPSLVSTTVAGATLTLSYDEALDENSEPAASAFAVASDTSPAVTVTAAAVSGRTVVLTLSRALAASETVTVSYTKPSTNPIRDVLGNEAPTLSDEAISDACEASLPSAIAVDWVVTPATAGSVVCAKSDGTIVLSNGIVERRIATSPNANTVSLKNRWTDTEMLYEGGQPEAVVSLAGISFDVGGSTATGGFVYSSHSIEDGTHKPYEWTPYLSDGMTVKPWSQEAPWPAAGKSVVFTYTPHTSVPAAYQDITVRIRYEIYDGIATMMKQVVVENSAAAAVELRDLTLDRLRIKRAVRDRLLIDTDYHGRQGVYRRNDYNRTYNQTNTDDYREYTILYKNGPAYHVGNRPARSGQRWETTFKSFRSFLLLHGTDHYEAQRMEFKKMYRTVAPQLREDLLFFHVISDNTAFIRERAGEAQTVGFEAVLQSFGSGFNMHNQNAGYRTARRQLYDQIRGLGLVPGGYQLFLTGRIYNSATSTCRPGSFGNSMGLASTGNDEYQRLTRAMVAATDMKIVEIDGAYPLDRCVASNHAYMLGEEDSRHKQWVINNEMYADFRSRDVYINAPDWHFLNGTNKSSIGYQENAWSRPRQEQLLFGRQYIYNGTYEKSPPWAWSFLPIEQYHGGGDAARFGPQSEKLFDYNWAVAQNFLSGVQHTFRGDRLYDANNVRDIVKYWVDVYKTYRQTIKSDIVHIKPPKRDPDEWARGTGIDAFMHAAPQQTERALVAVFNQTDAERTETLTVPVYYTGLSGLATPPMAVPQSYLSTTGDIPIHGRFPIREYAGLVPDDWTTNPYPAATATDRTADFYLEGAGEPTTLAIDSNGNAMLDVRLAPMSFAWYVVTPTGERPAAPPAKPLALRQLLDPSDTQYSGTAIGSGTAEGNGLAFDGDIDTYFDGSGASDHVGLDLGEGNAGIARSIRLHANSTPASRQGLNGARIQGSNDNTGWDDLLKLNVVPTAGWNDFALANTRSYRYYRLYGDSGDLDVAELEFHQGEIEPDSVPVGQIGGASFASSPDGASNAFDGDLATFYEGANAQAHVGLDQGAGQALALRRFRIYSAQNHASRVAGAKIQGSNSSADGGFEDLYTIPSVTGANWHETAVDNTAGHRWYRYQGGTDRATISELEFYSTDDPLIRPAGRMISAGAPTTVNPWPDSAAASASDGKPSTFYEGVVGGHVGVALVADRVERMVTPVAIAQTQGDHYSRFGYAPEQMIDGNGLSEVPTADNYGTVSQSTAANHRARYTAWSTGTQASPHYFSSNSNPQPQFTLDLGGDHNLTGMVVWGSPDNNRNEATNFTVEFSTDGGMSYGSTSVNVATNSLLGVDSEHMAFPGGPVEADHVRLTITGNARSQGIGSGAGGDRVSLGEIRFLSSVNSAKRGARVLKGVRFHPRASHPQRMVGGVIEGSQDGVTYTVLHTIAAEPAVGWNRVALDNTTAYGYYRYRSASTLASDVAEMEFWMNPSNVSRGAPVTVSSALAAHSGDLAVDGDMDTYWKSDDPTLAADQTVTVDLGAARTVDSIRIVWGDEYATTYQVHTSEDETNWVRRNFVFREGIGGTETLAYVEGVAARYVRITLQTSANNDGFAIRELRVLSPDGIDADLQLETATVTGNALTLTYNEALDEGSEPAASAFTVASDTGPAVTVTGVTVSGSMVVLTLSRSVAASETVTLSYAAPLTNPIQDEKGNTAAALAEQAVMDETAKPTVAITSTAALPTNGPFDVTLTFSADVTGFAAAEVTVTGGTAAASFTSSTARVYAIAVTPEADYAGDLTVEVAEDAAEADGVGNAAATATFAVDAKAPSPVSTTVAGATLTLSYDEALDESSEPAASAFAVTSDTGPAVTVSGVVVSGTTVVLTLSRALAASETVTVSYTAPQTNPVRDTAGNQAANLAGTSVGHVGVSASIIAGGLTIQLDSSGLVTGLFEGSVEGTDRNIAAQPTTLVSLVVEGAVSDAPSSGTGAHYKPTGWTYAAGTALTGETARGAFTFNFADNIGAVVTVVEKPGYATLQLTSLSNPDSKDIRHVLWGPLTTDITENLGDTVGVVSDRDFAIGMFGTNAKTTGGWPRDYDHLGFRSSAVGGDHRWFRSRLCRNLFWSCNAAPTTFGSILQTYTRDLTLERVYAPLSPRPWGWGSRRVGQPIPVKPLTGNLATHGQLVGSKVALFGVARSGAASGNRSLRDVRDAEVLDRVGAIEVGERMPHPIISNVWGKKAEMANAPYFIFTDLSTGNLDNALTLANELGWKSIYRNTGWGVFNDGSLGFGSPFGGNEAGLQAAVDAIKARHVSLGTHSLFSFVPRSLGMQFPQDLAVTYYGTLESDITATATELDIVPYPGTTVEQLKVNFGRGNKLVIGNELMRFLSVDDTPADRVSLSRASRGWSSTTATAHSAGARVGKLARPAYQGEYVAGLKMMYDVLVPALVEKMDLGITSFSYDGSEWLSRSHGAVGHNLVMEKVYTSLADNENFVHDGANSLSYTWHINSRYNWGETADDIPEAQQRRRWANNVYFQRNLMPPSLGWWRIDNANEWRWALAKAASFDAGFAYFGNVAHHSRYDVALRREIRGWHNATRAGAFDWPNRFVMQEQHDYFRLDKVELTRAIGPTWKLSDWAKSGDEGGTRSNGRYLAPQLRGFPLTNLARDAQVTVSGVVDPSYSGGLAVDNSTGVGHLPEEFFLQDGEGEWAIASGAAEKWIELGWDSAQKIRRIILFDRELADQNTSAGTLTFTHADNSTTTQTVTGIPADGLPRIVDFAQKTVTKVRFTITASSGTEPGLAEFVVLGPNAHYQSATLATGATVAGVTDGQAARVNDGMIAAGSAGRAALTGTSAVLDLGGQYYINGLAVWHAFGDGRTYSDVVFEVADNDQFANSTVVFNNDSDDSLGRGAGTDSAYAESSAGKLVQFAPVAGRYVRLWSNGNSVDTGNHLTEVEVYGTGNGTTDVADGGVTSGNGSASDLGNAVDHDPSTLADVGADAQYLQIDLGSAKTVNSLLVMRDNADMRTYKGVVYRLSTSSDFSSAVTTVFHNDNDNLHGLGLGESTDTEHQETENGRYVRFTPVTARYVRLYSAGSDYDTNNRYREVLVGTDEAGTAAPPAPDPVAVEPVADQVITPTAIALTQGDGRTDFSYALENLIDGSGLSEPPTVVNLDSVTHDSGSSARRWETNTSGSPDYFGDSSNYPDPQFTLTLDKRYSVSSLVFWGVGGNTNEASDFTVEFSTDGGTSYGAAAETVQTDSVAGNNHANLSFDMAHEANFVRLTVTNNAKGRGFAGVGGDRVGLGEMRFMGTDATPPGGPVAAAGSLATLVDTAGTLDLSTLVTGAEGTTLGYTATAPSNGTTSVSGSVVTYTPNTGYFGTDSFTYTVTDVADARVTATGVVSVTVHRTPTAQDATLRTPLNMAITYDLSPLASDPDGDVLEWSVGSATHGTVRLEFLTGGGVVYTPNTDYIGTDSFTYTVSDGHGVTATGTVTVTVQSAGTLVLNVGTIATDNTINIAEQAAGFAIGGNTGSEGGVSVTVSVGGTNLMTISADADPATWIVDVPADAAYITGTGVAVSVSASKMGYTPSSPVERTLAVDLAAPAAPTYTAPTSLKVGEAIASMIPSGGTGIDEYSAMGLPPGLSIDSSTGAISGTPDTADASTADATVTVSDTAGNADTVDIEFPAVSKGDQTLAGFGYSAASVTFNDAAPAVTAPTGAVTALRYTAAPTAVCTVDASTGALSLAGLGDCKVTVTAAGTVNYNEATAEFTVTVQSAGTLVLNVGTIAADNTINVAEQAAGFAIGGNTGSMGGVSVTVSVGGAELTAISEEAEAATWTVEVPAAASYIAGTSVDVVVSATKTGYTSPSDVERTLTVDLSAPTAPAYTAPTSLKVGEATASMTPSGGTGIDEYSAMGLPPGLSIDPSTGTISGTPDTADASTADATVTVSDTAGNTATVAIEFPAVSKGDQALAGFRYSATSVTFNDAAPAVTAPTGAVNTLSYSATPTGVCTVNSSSGALAIIDVGSCEITATAAGGDHYNQGTATFTVTVQAAGALVLNVHAIAVDNTINIAEKAAGFTIGGNTGLEGGVAVTVSVGGTDLTTTSAAADPATWSVSVPAAASYIAGTGVDVVVSAAKIGYTSPSDVERTLTVDLAAPAAPAYTAPGSLKVGEAIASMTPSGGTGIDEYSAMGLPPGLSIDSRTGAISGTPDTADADIADATVTVADTAGNTATVAIEFPAVSKGDQALAGFGYSAASVTFNDAAPAVTAPTGAVNTLSYSAAPTGVCTVNSSSGALTIIDVGSCEITATAAGGDDWNEATAEFTVTVQSAGTLVLNVGTIAADNTINVAEQAAGFAIGGNTGSMGGVSVTVSVGGTELTAISEEAEAATWSVEVPAAASYIAGTGVDVVVSAAKTGYTSPSAVERTLTVDLTAPTAPAYTVPTSLKVGEATASMTPSGGTGIDEYSAMGLPPGLSIDPSTGTISGTPDTADASTADATVTVSDTAGNTATVAIEFPAVSKGDQLLSGFQYSATSVTFGDAAPTVTAPTGAVTMLSYSATPATVCTVNSSTGALSLVEVGRCEITATAAGADNYEQATATYTVTVQSAGTLVLNVNAIATDNTINLADKAAGFAISGDTGSEGVVTVTVSVGGTDLNTTSADADPATWTVDVPADAAYITGTSVAVLVSASKTGYTPSSPLERTLAVDLVAPMAPAYTAPISLKVGEAIASMIPSGGTGIDEYSATGLPPGLSIDSITGAISSTPDTADASTANATVTVSDTAGNTAAVAIEFPAVTKGDQALAGFRYSVASVTFGDAAPTVTAPTGAVMTLSYSASPAAVCTVDAFTGALSLVEVGSCEITATAVGTANYNEATATVTVTVEAVGTLVLNVNAIATDNTINVVEQAAGFAISGDTGSVGGVAVTVTVGTAELTAISEEADAAIWTVSVPAAASYIAGTGVDVTVSATKTGYTSPSAVERTLTVDLAAPAAPAYTAPTSLKVGEAIASMTPSGGTGIDEYSAMGLPPGLSIDSRTGAISGTPDTADASTADATVTVSDTAGNAATVDIEFPAVTKGDQTLAGFRYSATSVTFGSTAPTVIAPTGAVNTLSYSATPTGVCTVNSSSGALTIIDVGSCEITATAAGGDDWNEATTQFTVTVVAVGTLALNVSAIAVDNTVNIAEKAAGFAISGNTGSVGSVSVTVSVGTAELTATSADADPATWSVSVPAAAPYIAGTGVAVSVSASKNGYTSPQNVARSLAVDLSRPTVPVYAAPAALTVGEEIAAISPSGGSYIAAYSATGLPSGLSIDSSTGAISGTPDTADADIADATVTVADTAGNSATVAIEFPAVTKGDQTLAGFRYSATSVTFGSTAPTVIAPTGAVNTLSYSATPTGVCTVNSSSGAFTIIGVGRCEITATAAGTDDWNEATTQFTVTVVAVGTLVLNVNAIAGDDTVNFAEKAAGFAISGDTGTEEGVSVTVTVGTVELTATSADANPAAWSVSVPQNAAYIVGTSVAVSVSASKNGFTSPRNVARTLAVNLTGPMVPVYAAPAALTVGIAIAAVNPSGGSGINEYSATGLPSGLSIDSSTGAISGTPDTADASSADATVTVSDTAGNAATVEIAFPAVAKGDQTLSGFQYSEPSVTFGGTAPSVTAPTGAQTTLSYSATPSSVCTVDASIGALTLAGVGRCEITATAAGTDDWNEATATFTLTVLSAEGDAPVAVDDTATVAVGGTVDIDVTANDTDADDTVPDDVTVSVVSAPSNGTATVNADKSIAYAHNRGTSTTDSFTYKLNDGASDSNIAMVSINVTGVNNAPMAMNYSANTLIETPLEIDLLPLASDVDGDQLFYQVQAAEHGTVSLNGSTVTYTPTPDFAGVDSFDYVISDGRGGAATGTVEVWVAVIMTPMAGQRIVPVTIRQMAGPAAGEALAQRLIDRPDLSESANSRNAGQATPEYNAAASTRWVTGVADGAPYFFSGSQEAPVFEMDLGGLFSLRSLQVAGTDDGADPGSEAASFRLEFSADGGATLGEQVEIVETSGVLGSGHEELAFTSEVMANWVRMTITDNAYGRGFVSDGGGDQVHMADVMFWAAPPPVQPTQVVVPASVEQRTGEVDVVAGRLIDGSGLSAAPRPHNVHDVSHAEKSDTAIAWRTVASSQTGAYFDGDFEAPTLDLVLGRTQSLLALVVWGLGGNLDEATDFTLEFSTDGGVHYDPATETVRTGALLGERSEVLLFDRVHDANAVRLTITENARGRGFPGSEGGHRVGLGEVRFLSGPHPVGTQHVLAPARIVQSAGDAEEESDASRLIDGSGLTAVPRPDNLDAVEHAGESTFWRTTAESGSDAYFDGARPHPVFELDLTDSYCLRGLVVWGTGVVSGDQGAEFEVEISTDGGATYGAVERLLTTVALGAGNVRLWFSQPHAANALRITVLNNAYGRGLETFTGGERVAIGELRCVAAM